jgi:preprotein translocase subunit SecA
MFTDLMHDIQSTFTDRFLKIQVSAEPQQPGTSGRAVRRPPPAPTPSDGAVAEPIPAPSGADDLFMGAAQRVPPPPPVAPAARGATAALSSSLGRVGRPAAATVPEVGRNDPCPCGSGKKYKKCHGAAR